MKIGYQGAAGSNSHCAAREFVRILGIQDAQTIPLVASGSVVRELGAGSIDMGVVAVRNSIAGIVSETKKAIASQNLEVVAEHTIPIHHALFKFPGVPNEQLAFVSSHPQALKQTQKTRASRFPNLREAPAPDTAITAAWLATGEIGKDTAILCPHDAGEMWGLELIADNMEDDSSNRTTFQLLKPPSSFFDVGFK